MSVTRLVPLLDENDDLLLDENDATIYDCEEITTGATGWWSLLPDTETPRPRYDCPIDGRPLVQRGNIYDCPAGHFSSIGPPSTSSDTPTLMFTGSSLLTKRTGADWGGIRAVIDAQPQPEARIDCPICGRVLSQHGTVYSCPAGHFQSEGPPYD